jgi:hypothetical protein
VCGEVVADSLSVNGSPIDTFLTLAFDKLFPIGCIYTTEDPTDPSNLFGGRWVNVAQGRYLVGVGEGTDKNGVKKVFSAGNNDGENAHTITVDEIPSHTHTFSTTSVLRYPYGNPRPFVAQTGHLVRSEILFPVPLVLAVQPL